MNVLFFSGSFSSFRMRHNQSFLNRVSFRRRTPTRETAPNILINSTMKSVPNSAVAAMRSCIDTLSETASITPSASMIAPHEGSSSGKSVVVVFFCNKFLSLFYK